MRVSSVPSRAVSQARSAEIVFPRIGDDLPHLDVGRHAEPAARDPDEEALGDDAECSCERGRPASRHPARAGSPCRRAGRAGGRKRAVAVGVTVSSTDWSLDARSAQLHAACCDPAGARVRRRCGSASRSRTGRPRSGPGRRGRVRCPDRRTRAVGCPGSCSRAAASPRPR